MLFTQGLGQQTSHDKEIADANLSLCPQSTFVPLVCCIVHNNNFHGLVTTYAL